MTKLGNHDTHHGLQWGLKKAHVQSLESRKFPWEQLGISFYKWKELQLSKKSVIPKLIKGPNGEDMI